MVAVKQHAIVPLSVGREERSSIKQSFVHKVIVSAVKRVEFISDMGLFMPVVLRSRHVRSRMTKDAKMRHVRKNSLQEE